MTLAIRELRGEMMDDPALNARDHAWALRGLRRINRITNSTLALWKPIRSLAACSPRPLRILELACGSGDNLLGLAKYASRHGIVLQLAGLDRSPTAIDIARQRASKSPYHLDLIIGDALSPPFEQTFDVVFCSLFLHHLSDDAATQLLSAMQCLASQMVLVSDLARTRTGYLYACLGTRLLSRSPIVHTDGLSSVEAAFTLSEIEQLAQQAGLKNTVIKRFWPERFLLISQHRVEESA